LLDVLLSEPETFENTLQVSPVVVGVCEDLVQVSLNPVAADQSGPPHAHRQAIFRKFDARSGGGIGAAAGRGVGGGKTRSV
jgi:hypothetical protein